MFGLKIGDGTKRKKRNQKHKFQRKPKMMPVIKPYSLPPEMTMKILKNLDVPDLVRCRQVCKDWKDIADLIMSKEAFMERQCKARFGEQYYIALRKAEPGISQFNLYRSLSLWHILDKADETVTTWLSTSLETDHFIDFVIIEGGYIGVHKRNSITYYDSTTMELSDRPSIEGSFSIYRENKYIVVVVTHDKKMTATKKSPQPGDDVTITYCSVGLVYLWNHLLYFIHDVRQLYVCDFSQKKLVINFVQFARREIVSMTYINGRLHLFDIALDIFVLKRRRNKLRHVLDLLYSPGLLFFHEIYTYKLFENLNPDIYLQWAYKNNPYIISPWAKATVARPYGKMLIHGNQLGYLRIYRSPFVDGRLFIRPNHRVKKYLFAPQSPNELNYCHVYQTDVFERVDGHTVLVAMADRIVKIDYKHPSLSSEIDE